MESRVHTQIQKLWEIGHINQLETKEVACVLIDVANRRAKNQVKGSGKDIKIRKSMYRNEINVEYDMYDYIGNNWTHRNTYKTFNKKLKKPYQENIQQIHYKRELYLGHHT
jgi:hypothetical protein